MFLTRTINKIFDLQITDAFCGLKGYKVDILPEELDHAGYSFPLVFWHYVTQKDIKIKEIETPIIYRLDRRSRGEWKSRTRNYFLKLESLAFSDEKKQIVNHCHQRSITQLTEIVDHYTDFPIYIYDDFFKVKWLDLE
jgi:hypothetical protein